MSHETNSNGGVKQPIKKCTCCGQVKPISEYYTGSARCKECKRKQVTAYDQAHMEEKRLKQQRYDQAHREEKRQKQQKYDQEHREQILMRMRGYYLEQSEEKRQKRLKNRYRTFVEIDPILKDLTPYIHNELKIILGRKSSRKWRQSHLEQARASSRMAVKRWRENHIDRAKEISRNAVKKYVENHPSYRQDYYKNNTGKFKEYRDKYWKTPKGKAIMHQTSSRRRLRYLEAPCSDIIEHVAEMKGNPQTCYWCGKELAVGECWVDHVVPIAKGGAHIMENVVASCPSCNLRKQDMMPLDYVQWRLKRGLLVNQARLTGNLPAMANGTFASVKT